MSEAAAALSAPAEAGVESDNGAVSAPSWTEGLELGEDTLAYINNKGWDSPDKLLESYRNLEKFQGGAKSLIEMPPADATDEQMAQFYDRLGRPSAADQYGFDVPEGADTSLVDWFGETAHRHGLSQKQAQNLFNEWNEMTASKVADMQNEMRVNNEADIENLKKEWGQDYETNLDAGKRAVAALGYDEAALSSLEEKMGTAEMLKLFSQIGSRMGEDNFVSGDNPASSFGQSPAQAQALIADLKADQMFMKAYMDGDKAAIAKMSRLMDKAYG